MKESTEKMNVFEREAKETEIKLNNTISALQKSLVKAQEENNASLSNHVSNEVKSVKEKLAAAEEEIR